MSKRFIKLKILVKFMGITFSQSIPKPQFYQSSKKIQEILKLYTFICQSYDSSLGKLKIFRKKEYNFDYVAKVDKLVERDYVDQLIKIAKINDICKLQNTKLSSDPYYLKLKSLTIIQNASLWLKIFGYEVISQGSNQNFKRIKVCYQYFNFTLKDYLERRPSTTKQNPSTIPSWIAYILATILDSYNQIKLLKILHPHLSITPILSSITTPSFIYIDIQGCLKFLPIPFFIMTDYSDKVDQCLVRCCRFEGDGQRMNVIVPKYGERSIKKQDEGFDKIDKIFMARLKKLIKYMVKQAQFEQIRDPITLHHPNSSFNCSNNQKKKLTYWEVLENTQSLLQMIRIISLVEEIQNCLLIQKPKNSNVAHQSMSLANHSHYLDKKREYVGIQNRIPTNSSQNMTTNSFSISNKNPFNLSQSSLANNNVGIERKITKSKINHEKNGKNNSIFYYLQ